MPTSICPRCWNKRRPCDKCQTTGKVEDVQLTKNFLLSELLYSPTAVEKGISNDPSPVEYQRLVDSAKGLFQPARDLLGPLKVTSGFRSPGLNKAIGGASNSAHMKAFAMDSQPQAISLEEAMIRLWKSNLQFDQAILELGNRRDSITDDWLHLGFRHPDTRLQRRQFLRMEKGIYTVWKPS
jgi:zinc D-Ala-D-Ala carboxypeptidase